MRRSVGALCSALVSLTAAGSIIADPHLAAAVTAPAQIGVSEPNGAVYTPAADYSPFPGLVSSVVGWTPRPGGGIWEVASDGGVFSRHAPFYGSLGRVRLAQPIVGMASTPDGRGYWLVASDGGIFTFGDARFHGSLGRVHLTRPIIAMAATPDGRGYWLVASDGGIFSFGDAGFKGSLGGATLNQPIVGMASNSTGTGYWLLASDGRVYGFGRVGVYGSMIRSTMPAVAISQTGAGSYSTTFADGVVYRFASGTRPAQVTHMYIPGIYVAAARQRIEAATAVAVALAQVGKPYSIGGNGPSSFDCSGLTKYAYAAAGVTLPRTAAQQLATYSRVSLAAAEPGDLLFFYPGIEHVGIYLGDGLMVDAPHAGAFVRVEQFSPWFGPVMGVTRPG